MVTLATSDGRLEFPDPFLRAVIRNAHRRADMTAAALDATGLFKSEPVRLPAAFLLEFSALLELGCWEKQGLRRFLDTDLPTFSEAAAALAARCQKGPSEFDGPDAAPLSEQVLQVRMDRLAWQGPELLQADIVVSDVDENEFAQVLTDFVWQHRHELSKILNKQP